MTASRTLPGRFFQFILLLFVIFLPVACNLFEDDGTSTTNVLQSGYFYLIDKATVRLVMLDTQLRRLKQWNLLPVTGDSSIQGVTFDGKYLWVSSAGSMDKIFQLDVKGDSLSVIKSFDAPPQGYGTIRDITWDGVSLWAVNSGSISQSKTPSLYKLNPETGAIIKEYPLPSSDPRGLTYTSGYTDVYGKATNAGICYTDVTTKMVYFFRIEFAQFDTLFSAPVPPRGVYNIYPSGLTFDGEHFWLVNSSNTADHLYRLLTTGVQESRFDLPYSEPGPIVWSKLDVRIPAPPIILSLSPGSGVLGETLPVEILGSGFKSGSGLSVRFGDGISADSLRYISPSQLHSVITIASNAVLGKRNVTVTNPGGRSTTVDSLFEITAIPIIPHLWLIEQDFDSLYQIRVSDTTVTQQWDTHIVAPGGSPQGLAWDGTNIWLCASGTDRKIYKLNTGDDVLSTIGSIPAPTTSGTLRGIVWDNGSLWISVSTIGRIYRVDPSTGAVLDSVGTPGIEPRGIVFANDQLYCNDTSLDSVFVYNTSTKSWKGVFATPTPPGGSTTNRFATGMTWDGHNFWIANSTTTFDHVFKVTPAGVVLQYFASPRIGPAQITGIVYTPQ